MSYIRIKMLCEKDIKFFFFFPCKRPIAERVSKLGIIVIFFFFFFYWHHLLKLRDDFTLIGNHF